MDVPHPRSAAGAISVRSPPSVSPARPILRRGLVYRLVNLDDEPHSPTAHEAVVAAAVELARRAAAAPRDLVVATKAALRATAVMPLHADAVAYETDPLADDRVV